MLQDCHVSLQLLKDKAELCRQILSPDAYV